MTAATVYLLSLLGIAAVVLGGGLVDLHLNLTGQETITDILRARPTLFWGPAGAMVGLLAVTAAHLFWEWPA